MPQVVDHLAELTRHRDRDLLDVTLVGTFRDLMQPRSAAIYRKIGEAGNERWLTRARLGKDDAVAAADPLWIDAERLPPLGDHPARCAALQGGTVLSRHGAVNVSVFPLATEREIDGVLELETDAALGPEAERLVRSILHVYRNFQCLLDYSERDTLTGLLNRKTFDDSFLKIISSALPAPGNVERERRAARDCEPYWVGMIDIDFFKSVNDRFGHLIGDEVLLLQSRLMRSTFRIHDRLYRFGGEEFVVLMRCPTAADTAQAFERLRRNTERFAFPQVEHITVSIGFAEVLANDSPSAALGRADQAVYYAKAHGRNQVQSYASLLEQGAIAAPLSKVGEVDLF